MLCSVDEGSACTSCVCSCTFVHDCRDSIVLVMQECKRTPSPVWQCSYLQSPTIKARQAQNVFVSLTKAPAKNADTFSKFFVKWHAAAWLLQLPGQSGMSGICQCGVCIAVPLSLPQHDRQEAACPHRGGHDHQPQSAGLRTPRRRIPSCRRAGSLLQAIPPQPGHCPANVIQHCQVALQRPELW